jgi:cell volume regulation protein A
VSVDPSILVLGLLVGIIAIAVFAEVLFHKLKIPEQIILLIIGLVIQYTGIISTSTHSYLVQIAPILGTFVLGLILLDAGFGMKAYDMLVRSPKIFALASLEPVVEGTALAIIMHYLLGWPWIYGAMLGTLLASTTPEVIVPLVRGSLMDEGTQNSIILDSTYNGVTSIVAFEALFGIAQSSNLNLDAAVSGLVLAFLVGIIIGIVCGFVWVFVVLKRITSHLYLITMAAAFGVYILSQVLGGNGFLSIILFGMVIGNYQASYRKVVSGVLTGTILGKLNEELKKVLRVSNDTTVQSLRASQKEITFITKTFFFVYLGILVSFTTTAILIGIGLSFVLIALEFLCVKASRVEANNKILSFVVPRGISPIILASTFYNYANTLATNPVAPSTYLLNSVAKPMSSITFTIILTTIIVAVVSAVFLTGGRKREAIPIGVGEASAENG